MPILELDHVSKSYGGRRVLKDVTLRIEPGQFILVTGANGAGKTTLLRLLSTYASPSSGRVSWRRPDGSCLRAEEIRARLGLVAHHPLLYDELTPRENLQFALSVRGISPAGDLVERWLGTFDLLARADEPAGRLSRGLKQRLALAQALAPAPELLLLDEPAAALDDAGLGILQTELTKTKGHAAVLLATHEPERFAGLANRRLILRDGTVREEAVAA